MKLDALQVEVERLLGLLKDRQEGLFTWNILLGERLTSVHELTGQMLREGPSDT